MYYKNMSAKNHSQEQTVSMTQLEVAVYKVAVELLHVLRDSNHNYKIEDFDLEDRARAFASTFPVLFKVEFHKDDQTVDAQQQH